MFYEKRLAALRSFAGNLSLRVHLAVAKTGMNKFTQKVLYRLMRIHSRINPKSHQYTVPEVTCRGEEANDRVKELLLKNKPCLVCRFGGTEMEVIIRHLDVTAPYSFARKSLDYITGKRQSFWWAEGVMMRLHNLSGFFPPTEEMVTRFSVEMLRDAGDIDILASWLTQERRLRKYLPGDLVKIPLNDLEPFFHTHPWTEALAGKKVLVIHPFDESIRSQYAKRKLLFKNTEILPDFELKTFKSVQSLVGSQVPFPDWFAALEWMGKEIDAIDFDVALMGAGAYGMPLAAHIKRSGRMAVHTGGVTQMLFGIRGKRWDDLPKYQALYNEHWTRPLAEEAPTNFKKVEGGCYW